MNVRIFFGTHKMDSVAKFEQFLDEAIVNNDINDYIIDDSEEGYAFVINMDKGDSTNKIMKYAKILGAVDSEIYEIRKMINDIIEEEIK